MGDLITDIGERRRRTEKGIGKKPPEKRGEEEERPQKCTLTFILSVELGDGD